jgi:DeoR family transcriptional regulator, fructose operon transcriptional repressor
MDTPVGSEKLKATRQYMIIQEVTNRGTMTVSHLSEVFGVAEITIRRDLDELSEAGHLERIWGGVRAKIASVSEPPVVQRQKEHTAEKQAIAMVASELIQDGDLIGLYMGTTTLQLARVLAQQPWTNLQVVTNGLPIVTELLRVPGIRLMCIGGLIDADEMAFNGSLTEQVLANIHLQKLFIGCRGIDAKSGVTNAVHAEKELGTTKAFVRASREVILLADYSKFGHVYFMQTIALTDIDLLITDDRTSSEVVEALRRQGIDTRVATVNESH